MNLDLILKNDVLWQMSIAEKASILYLLGNMEKRSVAIEVGSYKGGFLRVLAQYFDKVYSCDIDHSNIDGGKEQFINVEWVEGDSKDTLPELISRINNIGEEVNFILIDGDHSYKTVLHDINNVLQYQPLKSEVVLMIHDSWYEQSRHAINKAGWNDSPYVQFVEKDFVVGDLIHSTEEEGKIFVGGLALAVLSPIARQGDVEIRQTYDFMYRVMKQFLDGES